MPQDTDSKEKMIKINQFSLVALHLDSSFIILQPFCTGWNHLNASQDIVDYT